MWIAPLGTNVSEFLIGIQYFSLTKMHLKMSSAISPRNYPWGDLVIYSTSRLIWYVWYAVQEKCWWLLRVNSEQSVHQGMCSVRILSEDTTQRPWRFCYFFIYADVSASNLHHAGNQNTSDHYVGWYLRRTDRPISPWCFLHIMQYNNYCIQCSRDVRRSVLCYFQARPFTVITGWHLWYPIHVFAINTQHFSRFHASNWPIMLASSSRMTASCSCHHFWCRCWYCKSCGVSLVKAKGSFTGCCHWSLWSLQEHLVETRNLVVEWVVDKAIREKRARLKFTVPWRREAWRQMPRRQKLPTIMPCRLAGNVWDREREIGHSIPKWWCFPYCQTDRPHKAGYC